MSLTRSDGVLIAGGAVILAAGGTATASLLLSSPTMFYVAFPLGILGVFVAAAGYSMEESLARRKGSQAPSMGGTLGSGRLAASSQGEGARQRRDRTPRGPT